MNLVVLVTSGVITSCRSVLCSKKSCSFGKRIARQSTLKRSTRSTPIECPIEGASGTAYARWWNTRWPVAKCRSEAWATSVQVVRVRIEPANCCCHSETDGYTADAAEATAAAEAAAQSTTATTIPLTKGKDA